MSQYLGKIYEIDSLDDFKPFRNQVLVKPLTKNIERKTASGIWLVGDEEWNKAAHVDRMCEVVKVPDHLFFTEDNSVYSMEWETEMELQVGDVVWCEYLRIMYSERVHCQGQEYFLLFYGSIYVAKREEEIIPLNGYVLLERVYHPDTVIGSHTIKGEINKKQGIVRYVGSVNKRYKSKGISDEGTEDIKPVDKVALRLDAEVMLEEECHAMFDNGKMYRVEQRKNIIAVIE